MLSVLQRYLLLGGAGLTAGALGAGFTYFTITFIRSWMREDQGPFRLPIWEPTLPTQQNPSSFFPQRPETILLDSSKNPNYIA